MRISSGLSGALKENMYDGITVLGTISEGRFFRHHFTVNLKSVYFMCRFYLKSVYLCT